MASGLGGVFHQRMGIRPDSAPEHARLESRDGLRSLAQSSRVAPNPSRLVAQTLVSGLLAGLPVLAGCDKCVTLECPIPEVVLAVQATTDGGVVDGAQVDFAGESNGAFGEMTCVPRSDSTLCASVTTSMDEGSYTIRVSAPGYQSEEFQATVTDLAPPPSGCGGCPSAQISPPTVTLVPMLDAGV